MDYLPIFLDLRERACLVVGGGTVALHKVELLLRAGAAVRVVAPVHGAALRRLAKRKLVRLVARGYRKSDLRGVCLVIAATDRVEVNAQVSKDAQARSIPVNVVDAPASCSFIMPAIVDRGSVVVAVSTGGASPVLARLTRDKIEASLSPALDELAAFAKRHRVLVQQRIRTIPERRLFWENMLEGKVGALVVAGKSSQASAALRQALAKLR